MYYLCVNLFNRQYTGPLYEKVSVTIWCSNNIPIISVYIFIFDSSTIWSPFFQFFVVFMPFSFSSVLSLVEIVHAFKLLGFYSPWSEACLWLLNRMFFCFALSPDPQISSLFTFVTGYSIYKKSTDVYFSCYEILSNMSYSRLICFSLMSTVCLIQVCVQNYKLVMMDTWNSWDLEI